MDSETELDYNGDLSDEVSLASTSESQQDQDYEVETILADRTKAGRQEYLVKWLNYHTLKATWEPTGMFNSPETIKIWRSKKQQIEKGQLPQFDVNKFEIKVQEAITRHEVHQREREAQERLKRERLERLLFQDDLNVEPEPTVDPVESVVETNVLLATTPGTSENRHGSPLFVSAEEDPAMSPTSDGAPSGAVMATVPSSNTSRPAGNTAISKPPSHPISQAPKPSQPASSKASKPAPQLPSQPKPAQAARPATQVKTSTAIRPSTQTSTPQTSRPVSRVSTKVSSKSSTSVIKPPAPPNPSHRSSVQAPRNPHATGIGHFVSSLPPVNTAISRFTAHQTARKSRWDVQSRETLPDASKLTLLKPSDFPMRFGDSHATTTPTDEPFSTWNTNNNSSTLSSQEPGTTPSSTSQSVAPAALTSRTQTRDRSRSPRADRRRNSLPWSTDPRRSGPDRRARSPGPYSRRESTMRTEGIDRPDSPRQADCYRPREYTRETDSYRPSHSSVSSQPRGPPTSSGDSYCPSIQEGQSPTTRAPPVSSGGDSYRPPSIPKGQGPATRGPGATSSTGPSHPPSMPRVPASTNPLTGVDTARPSEARGASSFPIPTGPRDRRAIFAADEIARMPLGERKPGAIVTGNGHFFNPGEVLAHVLFGPERKPVGPVRICGMNPKAKVDMLAYKGKKNRNYEMAFHSLCTRDEYGYLCDQIAQQGMTNKLWCNAWMEGFRDTNENLFHMADYLRENSLMAIYYPADQRGNVWLAYSPRCPEFDFLSHDSLAVPDGVPIRLAVRAPLTPISAVETRPAALNVEHLIGSNKPSGPYALGSASSRPPSQPVSTGQDPRLNAHTQGQPHEQGVAASKSSDQNMAASLDPRLRRRGSMATSLPPARPSTSHEPPVVSGPGSAPGTDLVSGNSPRADPMDIQVPVSPPYEQTIIQVDDPKLALRRVFEDTLCISIDTLSQLPPSKEVPDESNSTDMFYLQFPEDEAGQAELKLLEEWLRLYDKKIWSNRDPAGWSKFCHNCKYGSVIVHEDKLFDLMKLRPPVYKFLWSHRVNFFSMKIAKPLALRDGRFFPEAAHYQAILAWGGAFLITEDLFLHDLRSTAMIICWFHYYHRETAGPCKLIVRPGILDALDARLENSKAKSEQINALLTVIAWVMKVNSIDSSHPTFDPASFDSRYMDRPNNNIITLPLLDYGSRSESDDHSIPRGLTQSERNADHLVDAFSGWTIIHSALVRRSIVITSVKNARLWDRWKTWGHIYPCTPNKFFEMHQINEEQLWDRVQSDGIPHLAAKFSTNSPVAPPGQASVAQPDDNQQVAFPSPVKDSSSSDEQRWRAPSHLQDPRQSLKSTSAPPK